MLLSLKQTVRELIEVVFPLRMDARIVKELKPEALLSMQLVRHNSGVISLLPFSHQTTRACIHEVKYHENQSAIDLLGNVLNSYLKVNPQPQPSILVPIPLSKVRRQSRGYNQVELIAKIAIQKTNIKLESELLFRTRDTVPQTTLKKAERLNNVADAFAIFDSKRVRETISNNHIIILDDVSTTGATLSAAKAALLPHQPKSITLLAIAH